MSARVTVVTPTLPQRHVKLLAACDSVREQTFQDWTHLIVPNGPDQRLGELLEQIGHVGERVRVVPLGQPHPTPGHWNRVLAGLIADTPYIAYLDDDNLWRPRHLEVLVGALEKHPEVGFAYSQLQYVDGRVLGDGQIRPGATVNHIDASMFVHRTELLREYATWDPHMVGWENSYALDGVLVDVWLQQGVRFAFVPEVTVDYLQVGYRVDGGGAQVAV